MIELTKKMQLSKRRTSLIAIAALALSLSVAGCKHPVDDATLNTNVQNKIGADAALSGLPIQITTANGVVTLSGAVDSDAARSLAAHDAMQVTGIKVLNNNLTVQAANAAPQDQAQPDLAPPPPPAVATASQKKPSPAKIAPAPAPSRPYQQAPAPIVENAPPPPPPPPSRPAVRTVTLAAGTVLPVRTTEALASNTSTPGSAFHGVLAADITDANGNLAFASGTPVTGQIVDAKDAAHFKGSSALTITLTSLSTHGDRIAIATEPYSLEGKGRGKNTAIKAGGGAAVGAILGGIFGGGKGAAIGAASGGALGAGSNAITKGEEVSIPSESLVRFRLTNTLSVTR